MSDTPTVLVPTSAQRYPRFVQASPAADLSRFAPIVALDGGESLFALEVAPHPEAHVRIAAAVGALVSAHEDREQRRARRPVAVMVSLSFAELERVDLESLVRALVGAGVPPDQLMIRVPQYSTGAHTPTLDRVAATGVTIVVGNLLVGPGEVGRLAGAPVDMIELPPALVEDVDRSPESAQLVTEWMSIAHRIDWLVLARNVRRPTQARTLQRLGCDLAAGPLIGAPVEPTPGAPRPRSRITG